MPRLPAHRVSISMCLAATLTSLGSAAFSQPHVHVGPGFFAQEIVTSDPQRFMREWAQPTAGVQLHTSDAIPRLGVASPFVVFLNCTPDAAGACHVAARFSITDPAGKTVGPPRFALWDRAPLGKGVFMCGLKALSFGFTDKDGPGRYVLTAVVTDTVSGASVTDSHAITYG